MMKQWTVLKNIISNSEFRKDIYLSLIDKDGNIICANANMQRSLHLKNPRHVKTNFFSLLHPEHVATFRQTINNSRTATVPCSAELYLKNGYYHPMKWQVNYLEMPAEESTASYLCVGYKLVDDERLKQFNEMGERNYQLIVEGLNAGILFQDKDGELIAANKKAAEIFDATLERLYQLKDIGTLWDSLWTITTRSGKTVSFHDTPFMKALSTRTTQSEELLVQLRNGEKRSVLFSSQPLFDSGASEPFSVVTNIVDVTVERQLSGKVEESDSLFRAFIDKTPNLAWVVDDTATLLFASRAFYDYFGLREDTAVNKNIHELVPASVADALYAKHMQVLDKNTPEEFVEKVKWADGTQFIFHINIFPISGSTNKRMIGGHAVNLADKYAVEKQLRDANDRLLMLSRATSDAIWEWDMQTGHIFRNDTLMEMVGYHVDDGKGLSWWLRRIHPADRNRVTDQIKDATDKGHHAWKDEYRFKCADGNYKHVQDKGYVVYENGLPVKMIGSLQDVTELKQLENQLVTEKIQRQKEISETVIRVQEKERTQIGHELHDNVNQILSTTKMFVEMITPANEEEKKIKLKSIEYLLTSIEEIRKLSKELVVPQLKENGLIDSIYTLVGDIELSGSMEINFIHATENELLTPGKKITLFRILQEQLKNILKYSKAKKVDIHLQYLGNDTQLIIKDDGVGFDPKQTNRGIGLSNIHDRARFYNGTVDIQTAPGKGCTLTVTIPSLS